MHYDLIGSRYTIYDGNFAVSYLISHPRLTCTVSKSLVYLSPEEQLLPEMSLLSLAHSLAAAGLTRVE